MVSIESKSGRAAQNSEELYKKISDLRFLLPYLKHPDITDLDISEDSISFSYNKVGKIGMRVTEKKPHSLVRIVNCENMPFSFNCNFHIENETAHSSLVKLKINADFNAFLNAVARDPLTNLADKLIDRLVQDN